MTLRKGECSLGMGLMRRLPFHLLGRLRSRLLRLLTYIAARAPWAWRTGVFSVVMRVIFDVAPPRWNDTTGSHGPAWTAPLEAGLDALPDVPSRVLDLGTGTGLGAAIAARRFSQATVTGIDVSPRMIARARGAHRHLRNLRFEVADARKLPFNDAGFTLVTALNVPPFFPELRRVTAPGGWVLIAFSLGERTPIYLPTPELEHRLEQHGFAEVRSGFVGQGTWTLARRDDPSVRED